MTRISTIMSVEILSYRRN